MSPKPKTPSNKDAKTLDKAIKKTQGRGADTSRMAGAVARDGKVSSA